MIVNSVSTLRLLTQPDTARIRYSVEDRASKVFSKGSIMKTTKVSAALLLGCLFTLVLACSNTPPKAPEVTTTVRQALDQAGLNNVRVAQDRDKGVVTLSGNVSSDNDRARAESVARSAAGTQVVANEIAVTPPGQESAARQVQGDLDKAIDKNLEARLIQLNLNREVRYDVKNGVITLKGDVSSPEKRASVEKLASGLPNVKQVVNELEVKNQKATSTER